MIRNAEQADAGTIARLAVQLWPSHSVGELTDTFRRLLADETAAVFLCFADDLPIGFAQCQLRTDYVEGTETSPVGYLEGIFITEDHRRQGHAGMLLAACEGWASARGCREFASDCELNNATSLAFHLHSGFQEANRIICFAKKL